MRTRRRSSRRRRTFVAAKSATRSHTSSSTVALTAVRLIAERALERNVPTTLLNYAPATVGVDVSILHALFVRRCNASGGGSSSGSSCNGSSGATSICSKGVLRVVASKSEAGQRSIAIPLRLRDESTAHYRRTPFKGDGELVFCHSERGTHHLSGRDVRSGAHSGSRGRRRRREAAGLLRPQTRKPHERRRGGRIADRVDDAGRAYEHEHDEAVSASRRDRVPRRS